MRIKWFTLIELLIAVTISALIMTSVLIFTWDMIRGSLSSQKLLNNQNSNAVFDNKLQEVLNNIWSWAIFNSWASFWDYGTGIILYTNWNSPLTYIGTKTFTGYCDSAWLTASATWVVEKLIIKEIIWKSSHTTTTNYIINTSKNSIYSSWWVLIIGTGIKWDSYSTNPLKTELSSPTAIFETTSYLYIADNWNNRILSYDKDSNTINKLATYNDGINNPTDIMYSSKELYITNAWNGNILKIKDWYWTWAKLNTNITITQNLAFDNIKLKFDWIPLVSWPNILSLSEFSWIASNWIQTWATLIYGFASGTTLSSGTTLWINIDNITPAPTVKSSYWVNISFYSWAALIKNYNRLYFINWDDTVGTRIGNIIEVLTWWLLYPNNITTTTNWDSNITDWTDIFSDTWATEYISEFPVKNFGYQLNNKILNIKYNYYKNYDCINEKHIIKERNYIKYVK